MSKKSQNLVVWMDPTQKAYETSLKAGKMILNRFCIDEDAAFELSGVNSLKKTSEDMKWGERFNIDLKKIQKGKEYSF